MEAHNFNILESKIRQAIEEIKKLKNDNAQLRSKLNNDDSGDVEAKSVVSASAQKELLQKVDDMIEVLDQI